MGKLINVLALSAAALAQPAHREVAPDLTTVMSEVKAQTGMNVVVTDSKRDPNAQAALLTDPESEGWSFVVTDGLRVEQKPVKSSSTHITGKTLSLDPSIQED